MSRVVSALVLAVCIAETFAIHAQAPARKKLLFLTHAALTNTRASQRRRNPSSSSAQRAASTCAQYDGLMLGVGVGD